MRKFRDLKRENKANEKRNNKLLIKGGKQNKKMKEREK
jgi:hypothetical protein